MKLFLWNVYIFALVASLAGQPCDIGCLLQQGPEYQYGDVTFGQWNPNYCCKKG